MRLRVLLITFIVFTIMSSGTFCIFYLQIGRLQDINLESIQNRLYAEDTNIMLWAINNIDPIHVNDASIPESWGEIMIVDNNTLKITSSTNNKHKNLYMHKLPKLLDQATPVLKAINDKKSLIRKTKDYMIVIKPLENNTSIVGLKPKAWEAGIISDQTSVLMRHVAQAKIIIIISLAIGILLSLIAALIVSVMVTKSTRQMLSTLDDLSLGKFNTQVPESNIYEAKAFATSFERLKTSLTMSLERLGVR
ncbi:MAG: hypothetical protein J7L53_10370 [Deltaproteobacteria bacterium]|nr:hypothetical protein [Deltaproteobacteria bacterium]